jgi:hypothetical protein
MRLVLSLLLPVLLYDATVLEVSGALEIASSHLENRLYVRVDVNGRRALQTFEDENLTRSIDLPDGIVRLGSNAKGEAVLWTPSVLREVSQIGFKFVPSSDQFLKIEAGFKFRRAGDHLLVVPPEADFSSLSGGRHFVLSAPSQPTAPSISPSGTRIAAVATCSEGRSALLYLWTLPTGATVQAPTKLTWMDNGSAPDGRLITGTSFIDEERVVVGIRDEFRVDERGHVGMTVAVANVSDGVLRPVATVFVDRVFSSLGLWKMGRSNRVALMKEKSVILICQIPE